MPGKEDYKLFHLPNTHTSVGPLGGTVGGNQMSVIKGEDYDIEIFIGNEGGLAHLYLMTQEVAGTFRSPVHREQQLPIYRSIPGSRPFFFDKESGMV